MKKKKLPNLQTGTMKRRKKELIRQARARYGRILPCVGKTFPQCFLNQNGKLQFWFNDTRGNTHLLYGEQQTLN